MRWANRICSAGVFSGATTQEAVAICTETRAHSVRRRFLRSTGLLGGFGGDASVEARHHEEELRRAAECLQKAIAGIDVRAYFVDFEGIWAVELTQQFVASAPSQ